MNINEQIKANRLKNHLSQETLADKIYVTRQTISNWETNKCYPDIHSLILMSQLFNVTLDQLVEGDLENMKTCIEKENIENYKRLANLYAILFITFILAMAPLLYFLNVLGFVIAIIWFLILIAIAFKVEKVKKENDIQTYKEIVAFINGEHLDDISKQREYGKRNYQKFLLALGFGIATFIIVLLLLNLFKTFM